MPRKTLSAVAIEKATKLEVGKFEPFQVEVWSSTNWLGKHSHDGEGRRSPRSPPKPRDTSLEPRPDLPAAQKQLTPRFGAKRVALLPNHQSVSRSKRILLPPTSLTNTVSRRSCCWRRRGLGFHLVLSFKAQWSRVKSSAVAGGVATVFSVTWRRNVRTQHRRMGSGTISESQTWWRLHRVARPFPRQLETTPVTEVVSALCGSCIFADVPPTHHDLGCLVLITQVVRNGSFAKVLRTRIATHLPGIHVSGLNIEFLSLVMGGQRDPTVKRRV